LFGCTFFVHKIRLFRVLFFAGVMTCIPWSILFLDCTVKWLHGSCCGPGWIIIVDALWKLWILQILLQITM
jgi:hypothetical protein